MTIDWRKLDGFIGSMLCVRCVCGTPAIVTLVMQNTQVIWATIETVKLWSNRNQSIAIEWPTISRPSATCAQHEISYVLAEYCYYCSHACGETWRGREWIQSSPCAGVHINSENFVSADNKMNCDAVSSLFLIRFVRHRRTMDDVWPTGFRVWIVFTTFYNWLRWLHNARGLDCELLVRNNIKFNLKRNRVQSRNCSLVRAIPMKQSPRFVFKMDEHIRQSIRPMVNEDVEMWVDKYSLCHTSTVRSIHDHYCCLCIVIEIYFDWSSNWCLPQRSRNWKKKFRLAN